MTGPNFTVYQTPEAAFADINDVRGLLSGEIEGDTDRLGAEFSYRYEDFHSSKQKVAEFAPARKVVWHVVDGSLNFVEDRTEWRDTDIVFEISAKQGRTEVRFTHVGLVPAGNVTTKARTRGAFISRAVRGI